ncbi:MAG: hypothetical protein E7648_02165 [Ruminococcaceae bacterium]|nr:hypothetical protein [Oscillospiraceae bacterium]
MNPKKYIEPSKAAEVLSEKLNVPVEDLVDIFSEIPSALAVECKHCGKPIRFPVAFHTACFELAAGAVMEKVCDKYCRFPCECKSQEELDKHCDACELVELLNLMSIGSGDE